MKAVLKVPKRVFLSAFVVFIFGCSSIPSPRERLEYAYSLSKSVGWNSYSIPVKKFVLQAFVSDVGVPNNDVFIYLEGDGFSWKSIGQISDDPTPLNPVGLKLALRQKDGNVAYLARPCQYQLDGNACAPNYWTNERFSSEIVEAMNVGINEVKKIKNAQNITLIGYSGGGALAVLIASRRSDVKKIVTIGGNLDHEEWAKFHALSRLEGSLSPVDVLGNIGPVSMIHLYGEDDVIFPRNLVNKFMLSYKGFGEFIFFPGLGHQSGWVERWSDIVIQYIR